MEDNVRILMPASAFRHTKELYPVFWAKSVELVSIVDAMGGESHIGATDGEGIEVNELTSRTTLNIIGVAGFG